MFICLQHYAEAVRQPSSNAVQHIQHIIMPTVFTIYSRLSAT